MKKIRPIKTTTTDITPRIVFLTSSRFVKGKDSVFGEVAYYWFRFEEQGRGNLHLHLLLWLKKETVPGSADSQDDSSGDDDCSDSDEANERWSGFYGLVLVLGSCSGLWVVHDVAVVVLHHRSDDCATEYCLKLRICLHRVQMRAWTGPPNDGKRSHSLGCLEVLTHSSSAYGISLRGSTSTLGTIPTRARKRAARRRIYPPTIQTCAAQKASPSRRIFPRILHTSVTIDALVRTARGAAV